MDVILAYLQNYWGIILFVIGFITFLVTQGKAEAAQIILSLMLRAEKEAECLVLKNGDEKFSFVVDYGYRLLPRTARLFITYTMFSDMAKIFYASAKNYLLGIKNSDENQKPKQV
ncbi:hypothetical protein [Desulfosporosinus meridiei]|uniref:Uncharacterized protein n=1 Tax=Desulfosporosinus meridiei (strain ATCC BAA-275 / DSM 13257 / KCTC 12902 / NCIMB 13706 / S10) TaxID=768704 RepID=J7ITV0_DESMD|nr:hypothetical protein [Desulfosporosinus meridiei]AFQ45140.1 hypothetical protein Desmer_3263 [Desulfosporosinus meridiei DSM 13257]